MDKFDRGSGSASYNVADGGIVCASMSGLVVPTNGGALSTALLEAAADRGSCGVLVSVQSALVALPPLGPQHYGHVADELLGIALAVLVTPEQLAVYEHIAHAAALSGTIRRAFLSREEAQRWIRERARALAANRVWWSAHRSLP